MAKIIEAKAVISAEDRTGAVFDKIAKKFANVGKGAKVSAEVDRLAKSLQKTGENLKAIDSYKGQRGAFYAKQNEMRAAKKAADDAARALGNAAKPTRALEQAYAAAKAKADAATAAFERQKTAVLASRRALTSGGVAVDKLIGEQTRLAAAVDKTSAALMKQARIDRDAKVARDLTRTKRAEATQRQAKLAEELAERRQNRRDAWKGAAGIAGIGAVHKAERFGAHALHTYQEFDNERRFGRAVMGITDEEQRPLVDQAVHMGGSTRYNDIQVLEAQRELAARGLKKDQVMGLMEPAAALGQSLDLRLPDAVKQMEGAIFGFNKDISTLDAAKASARQTADVQVKAAKISGMTPDDITATYKYGATPARMGGLSEETLLAFAGISKKANMGGDEAGTAFRALVANALSPTRKAKEAMLANGMDYKNYQRNPDQIDTAAFVKTVAAQYGVKLGQDVQAGLGKIFTDKKMIASPETFTPAVMKLLSDNLGGDDAKSKKSIAGLANRFRDASMRGVDSNKLFEDLMREIPKNPALANAIFGSKQGARIGNALGSPDTFRHMLDELVNHSAGYADNVSGQRNAGFDGAKRRLDGAVTNAESKLGRALDGDGNGGALTAITDSAGKLVQSFSELDNRTVQVAAGVAAVGTALVGIKSIGLLADGFGLKTSAVSLTGAAEALTLAAGRLGAAGAADAAGGLLGGKASKVAKLGALGFIGTAGLGIGAVALAADFLDGNDPHNNRANGYGRAKARPGLSSYPATWGAGGVDVSGGAGGSAAQPYTSHRDRTWWEALNAPSFRTRGAADPTRQDLPSFGAGRSMQMPGEVKLSPDSRLEATVKPDQITAKVENLPPITGTLEAPQGTLVGQLTVLPSPLLTAKLDQMQGSISAMRGTIGSSGARAGATTMPGAASTPGAQ